MNANAQQNYKNHADGRSASNGELGIEPFYGTIEIQAKDETCDWRSFAIFRDASGVTWELRGYGKTPADAASDAYSKFKDKENWDVYGYEVPNDTAKGIETA